MKKNKIDFKCFLKWLLFLTIANYGIRLFVAYLIGTMLKLSYDWNRFFYIIPRIEFSIPDEILFKSISTISLLIPAVFFFLFFMIKAYLMYREEEYKDDLWKLFLLWIFLLISSIQYLVAIFIDYRLEYENYFYGFFIVALSCLYAWFVYTRIRKKCNNQ